MGIATPPLPRFIPCLMVGALLAACGNTPEAAPAAASTAGPAMPAAKPAPAVDPGRIVLAAGQSAEFEPSYRLHYVALTNDSRCPSGAQCAWAGEVRLAMALESPNGRTEFELASGSAPEARVQRKQVHLLDFGPCPASVGKGDCASFHIGR